MTLDEAITRAAREGRLHTLTLWRTREGWQANAKTPEGGWCCITTDDPAAGLLRAVSGLTTDKHDEGDIFG